MKAKYLLLPILVLISGCAVACPYCKERPLYWEGVFNDRFGWIMFSVVWPMILLHLVGLAFLLVDRSASSNASREGSAFLRRGPLLAGAVILGIGLGGNVDGIFLHMILQWHHLISTLLPPTSFVPLEVNNFWDGIFSLGMWVNMVVGLWLVWRASRIPDAVWSGRLLVAGLFIGWGIFNVGDSIFFHWILNLHHIYEGHDLWLWFDLGFLAAGLIFIAAGWRAARRKNLTQLAFRPMVKD